MSPLSSVGVGVLAVALVMVAVAAPARAELRAGTAKADVTPPLGGHMYGYGDRGDNVSSGVHDRLYAKALVLAAGSGAGAREIAIVTLDLGAFEKDRVRRVKEAVRGATGIEHLFLVASHTHSAPVLELEFPTAQSPYHLDAERRIAAAVAEARAAMRPARLAVGWGQVEEGHNRREVLPDGTVHMRWANRERKPTEPVDHALGVIAIDGADGKPIATLVNFACHPVVLGPENLEISADYPGAMMAKVESAIGGQAMFVQGAAGDINPFWDKTAPADGGFEQMKKMGETVAAEVLRVRAGLRAAGRRRRPHRGAHRDHHARPALGPRRPGGRGGVPQERVRLDLRALSPALPARARRRDVGGRCSTIGWRSASSPASSSSSTACASSARAG